MKEHTTALQKIRAMRDPTLRRLYAQDLLAVCLGDAHQLLTQARQTAEICQPDMVDEIDDVRGAVADILIEESDE